MRRCWRVPWRSPDRALRRRQLGVCAGGVYGAGAIGVPALYGLLTIALIVSLVGYVRWDERRHSHR